ncbi:MAG: recombinase family protein [Clostridium butyricum]|uniref:recombinase family protein n=1 Tax=Clostridium sp. TaxID=1506 RepID=UPI0028FE5086|nr:recombinase family protein [Clostridium sp.]MDU1116026.1 recombinase family protein [Clostridium sp.]MDU7712367.1 recombinase family protein [Clostridium butyricum]
MGKKFGYVRCSSKEQNYQYQIDELKKYGINEALIFADKESGKNFKRKEYLRLKEILGEGDELYITALDRFGRNAEEMEQEYRELQAKGVILRILDFAPSMMEVKQDDEMSQTMFKMMSEMMFKFMSYMAEMERKKIKKKQRQGIDSMPVDEATGKRISSKTGRAMGRPSRQFPDGWEQAYNEWKAGKVTAIATMGKLGLKRNTFYRLVKDYKENRN